MIISKNSVPTCHLMIDFPNMLIPVERVPKYTYFII